MASFVVYLICGVAFGSTSLTNRIILWGNQLVTSGICGLISTWWVETEYRKRGRKNRSSKKDAKDATQSQTTTSIQMHSSIITKKDDELSLKNRPANLSPMLGSVSPISLSSTPKSDPPMMDLDLNTVSSSGNGSTSKLPDIFKRISSRYKGGLGVSEMPKIVKFPHILSDYQGYKLFIR